MNSLAKLDKVDYMLTKALADNNFKAILEVRDMAMGAAVVAMAKNDFENAQRAKIAQLKSERAAGGWLNKNVNHSGNKFGTGLHDATPQDLPDGVDKYESHRWQTMWKLPEQKFLGWIDECLAIGKEIYANALYAIAKRYGVSDERENSRTVEEIDQNITVGDMREVGASIPDNSIDLILTDPPYPSEYLPLFSDLSALARRVLRIGGLCMVYSGQIHLPEVYQRLGESLEYLWTFAIRHTGGAQRIFRPNVNTAWKPVLGYVKPPLSIYWDSFIDVCSGGMEKDLHKWQQPVAEAAYFIEHLSPESGLILDPFCGSGTVLVAAKKLGRQYIGIEADEQTASVASRRLNDC